MDCTNDIHILETRAMILHHTKLYLPLILHVDHNVFSTHFTDAQHKTGRQNFTANTLATRPGSITL